MGWLVADQNDPHRTSRRYINSALGSHVTSGRFLVSAALPPDPTTPPALHPSRVVVRVVVSIGPVKALSAQAAQVSHGRHRLNHRRQRAGVGRDDQLVPKTALEPEARRAEGLVLVRAMAVDNVVRAF